MKSIYSSHKSFSFSLILCIAIAVNINAGGIAGPDRTICKGDTIMIGQYGGSVLTGAVIISTDCYRWEPPLYMEDPHNYKTRVWPEQTMVYKVTRTSADFSETETATVVIKVVDKINSITATPNECCWNKGDKITIDQFNVTTDPPGMGDLCDVSPTLVPGGLGLGGYTTEVTISNQCSSSSYAETKINIDCADKDIATGFSPIGIDFGALMDIINSVPAKAKILPCDPGTTISGTFTISNFKQCCPDRKGGYLPCIDPNMIKLSGEISYEVGVTCRYPFGCPYVAAAYAVAGIGGGGKVEASLASTCKPPVEVCIEFTPYGYVMGGVEFELGPGVIEASGIIKGTLTIPALKYCNTTGLAVIGDEICAQVDGEVSVTLANFLTKKVSHTFWKGCL